MHIFSDNLSRNNCIQVKARAMSLQLAGTYTRLTHCDVIINSRRSALREELLLLLLLLLSKYKKRIRKSLSSVHVLHKT